MEGHAYNLFVKMAQEDKGAVTQIIDEFMPLIKKYSRDLGYDGAEFDLIIAMIKIIKVYPLRNYIYFDGKNIGPYISKSMNHEYIRLSKKCSSINKTKLPLNEDILTSATDEDFEERLLTSLMLTDLPRVSQTV